MYDRLFTFGCSFTQYRWMTWADILGCEANEFYNFGASGSGNLQIFIKLIECCKSYNLNGNDTVMIMWTNTAREDHFINNEWVNAGTIFNSVVYPDSFVKKFADEYFYLKRDLALIASAKSFLDNLKINYRFFLMLPLYMKSELHQNLPKLAINNKMLSIDNIIVDDDYSELLKLYHNDIKDIPTTVFEILNNSDWYSKKSRPILYHDRLGKVADLHPTPNEHLEYLKYVFPTLDLSNHTLSKIQESQNSLIFIDIDR